MAVTHQKSAQLQARGAMPMVQLMPADNHAKLRLAYFSHTQDGAGDAASTVELVELPAGKTRILAGLSRVQHSAFGASRTLNIGHDGYIRADGTQVAADADALHSAADVSSAGGFVPDDETGNGKMLVYDSRLPVKIKAAVAGGTIPNGATLAGYIVYAID